jgi:tRNA A-37 threonylcarbamoyl transferase component Bud32
VYDAHHVNVNKRLAIKVLRPEVVAQPDTLARFRQEARSASSIGHPNIIAIEDFVALNDGTVYLAMEYLEGEPLGARMRKTPPLGVIKAVELMLPVCDALFAAHQKGIVHRDMKPDNIFLAEKGGQRVPKILDFGIAKVSGEEGALNLTRTGAIFGTPLYMSPEQASGSPADHRTDIYSTGVILYELLTGRVPFKADSAVQVLSAHIATNPPPPSSVAPERNISPALEAVILRALAKQADERQASMQALAEELRAAIAADAHAPMVAPAPPVAASPVAASPATARVAPSSTTPSPSGRGWIAPVAIVGAVVIAAVIGLVLLRRPPPEPPRLAAIAPGPPKEAVQPAEPPAAPAPAKAVGEPDKVEDEGGVKGKGKVRDGDGDRDKVRDRQKEREGKRGKGAPIKPAAPPAPVAAAAPPVVVPPPVAVAPPPPPRPAAPVSELVRNLDRHAATVAPGAHRTGPIYGGQAQKNNDRSDWYFPLEMGRCYAFVATGGPGVEELLLYLWGPDGKRAAPRAEGRPTATIQHCARAPGQYHFQAKVGRGQGEYKMAVYAR